MEEEKIMNEWDEYAKDWESNQQVIQYAKLAFANLEKVIRIEGINILDFGCGTGLLSELMSPLAKKIVALDPSTEMTSVLKNKNLPNIKVINEILTQDLIRSNELFSKKFDLIVASSVCGFLPNYLETLKIFKSILTHDGIFIQWDWLANKDNSEIGLTKNEIAAGFKASGLELTSLTEAFSIEHDSHPIPVIMAIGRNL